jgi:GAF domain-containing protein
VAVLQTLADQVALAIENARLLEESQQALRELEALYGRQALEAWAERAARQPAAYRYTRVGVEPASDVGWEVGPPPEQPVVREGDDGRLLIAPVRLRGQVIGSVLLRQDPEEEPWSPEEVALVEDVTAQIGLALENARLLEETRERAAWEQTLSAVTARIRAEAEIDMILERALEELGRALGAERAFVQLTGLSGRPATQGGDGGLREVEG